MGHILLFLLETNNLSSQLRRNASLKDGEYLPSVTRLVNSRIRTGIPGFMIPHQVLLLNVKVPKDSKSGLLRP